MSRPRSRTSSAANRTITTRSWHDRIRDQGRPRLARRNGDGARLRLRRRLSLARQGSQSRPRAARTDGPTGAQTEPGVDGLNVVSVPDPGRGLRAENHQGFAPPASSSALERRIFEHRDAAKAGGRGPGSRRPYQAVGPLRSTSPRAAQIAHGLDPRRCASHPASVRRAHDHARAASSNRTSTGRSRIPFHDLELSFRGVS